MATIPWRTLKKQIRSKLAFNAACPAGMALLGGVLAACRVTFEKESGPALYSVLRYILTSFPKGDVEWLLGQVTIDDEMRQDMRSAGYTDTGSREMWDQYYRHLYTRSSEMHIPSSIVNFMVRYLGYENKYYPVVFSKKEK